MKNRPTGDLYFIDSGEKTSPPIILIHGSPFSLEMWAPQIALLQKEFRVIAYDVRGHGDSPKGDGQYTLEFFVDDLIALMDRIGLNSVALCGLSMGGYIALRAMERNPERFNALVLCDTRSEADPDEAKLKRSATIRNLKEHGVPAFADHFLKNVLSPSTFQNQPDVVDLVRRIILMNDTVGITGSLLAIMTRTDTTESLARIQVPTLIMVGEEDRVTPVSSAQALQSRISDSELVVIPSSAHLPNLENPDEFNQHFIAFLRKTLITSTRNIA